MKHLFLTSAIGFPGVSESIRSKLGHYKKLKTVFITTATEVVDMSNDAWYQEDRSALAKNGFKFFDYTISNKNQDQIKNDLKNIEALYISGGNTFYLLQQSQLSRFDNFVRKILDEGVIYIGTSAGSCIAGPDISPTIGCDDVSLAPDINGYAGYGLVDFTILPHWGSSEFKKEYLSNTSFEATYKEENKLIALNNHEYVEVIDDKYHIIDVRNKK